MTQEARIKAALDLVAQDVKALDEKIDGKTIWVATVAEAETAAAAHPDAEVFVYL